MKKSTEKAGIILVMGFPGGSVVKNPPANAEDAGSIPGSGRSPGLWERHSSSLSLRFLIENKGTERKKKKIKELVAR